MSSRTSTLVLFALVFLSGSPTAWAAIADRADTNNALFEGAWAHVLPSGTLPPARRDPGVAYDSKSDRLVVIGGAGGGNLTWLLNLSGSPTWTSVGDLSPPTVTGDDRAVFDPDGNRVVLVTSNMDVWTLDLDNPIGWSQAAVDNSPPPRRFFAATYDAVKNRMLIFGGGPYEGLRNDVWALSMTGALTWTQIIGSGDPPAPRWGPMAAFDESSNSLLIASGSLSAGYAVSNDVWALSLDDNPAWKQLLPSGALPPKRMLSNGTYDPEQQRMILYGGYSGVTDVPLTDIWQLSLSGLPTWTRLMPAGAAPPGRWSYGAAYRAQDSQQISQMLIFGGWAGGENDVWEFELSSQIGPPQISDFSPKGGRIGDLVTISGLRLEGALDVLFNGTSAPVLSSTFTQVTARVPLGATSGPIGVVTASGSATTDRTFFIGETPVILAAIPDAGKVGTVVALTGEHFTGTTRVAFGTASNTLFTVNSDTRITAVVDKAAVTGPIRVTTPAATGTSPFSFNVIPPDTAARIVNVRDVPGDQGGRVVVRWLRSDLDAAPDHEVGGYRVWRRAPLGTAAPAGARAAWRREVTSSGVVTFWEPLAEIPASTLEGYAFVAPTTQDSTEYGNPWTAFFVQALGSAPFVSYNSAVDSGYSVDNLAPHKPPRLSASYGGATAALHWGGNAEADFLEYRLYRGGELQFATRQENLVYAGADTSYEDIAASSAAVYKLTAVDIHGNESRCAMATSGGSTTSVAFTFAATAEPSRVTVEWYLIGGPAAPVQVYRKLEGSPWRLLAAKVADGAGMVRFVDDDVRPGQRIGYRLGLFDANVELFSDETWVTVPAARLALLGVAPNPMQGGRGVLVRLSLPANAPATLQLIDIAGRIAARAPLEVGTGVHLAKVVWDHAPSPGMYLLRLSQAGSSVSAKVVVLD